LNKGNITPVLTFTSSGVLADDGWNLIGNPYASQIDWNAVTKNNISSFYYSFNPATGSYAADDGENLIASGQAFFVQTIGASPSITFTENSKATNAPTNYFKSNGASLTATMIKDSLNSD